MIEPPPPIAAEFHRLGRLYLEQVKGTPFKDKDARPHEGFDCRGIVVWWYGVMGLPLRSTPNDKTYPADYWRRPDGTYLMRLEEQFRRIPDRAASFGDLVLFKPHDKNILDVAHTGIVDDPATGAFWHAFLQRGVDRSSLTEPYWRDRIFGYMRHENTHLLNARRGDVPGVLRV